MRSVFCRLSVFSVCSVFISTVWSESVPIPENVRLKSLDMGLVLEWDLPQNTTNKVFNYTAELKIWKEFEPVCVRSSSLSCDFTDNISIFGTSRLRVRTELHGDASEWVETEEIAVDRITEISAPRVELTSRKGQTEVDITDPPMRKKNMRDHFRHISYLIRFWKKGETKKEELIRDQTRVMLPDLEPLVNYCVEVAVLVSDYNNNKTSQLSNTTCVTNSPSGEVESWLIAVVVLVSFLVVVVAVVLIFLAVWYSYKGFRIIFPDPKLPENLKQILSQQSPILSAMQESTQPKELCHELRIFHREPEDHQTEGPSRADEDECCTEADTKHSREERSETASTSSEEQRLLAC